MSFACLNCYLASLHALALSTSTCNSLSDLKNLSIQITRLKKLPSYLLCLSPHKFLHLQQSLFLAWLLAIDNEIFSWRSHLTFFSFLSPHGKPPSISAICHRAKRGTTGSSASLFPESCFGEHCQITEKGNSPFPPPQIPMLTLPAPVQTAPCMRRHV